MSSHAALWRQSSLTHGCVLFQKAASLMGLDSSPATDEAPGMRAVAVAALLVVILSSALAQQQKVSACQSSGTTCMTCTIRQLSSDDQCGWCGNVTKGSTQGLCLSQSDYKSNPSLCIPNLPAAEGFRTGPPEAACLPLADLQNLIRTINIIIGVVVGIAVLNAIVMCVYVRRQRKGTVIQTVCWTAVGLIFPLLSWFMLCCCGPDLPASQNPSVMMVNYGQGSAPPLSDSVPPAFNPAYNPQQQQMYYAQQYPAQQQPPPYGQPAPYAQPPPAYAYPPQAATFYQTGSV